MSAGNPFSGPDSEIHPNESQILPNESQIHPNESQEQRFTGDPADERSVRELADFAQVIQQRSLNQETLERLVTMVTQRVPTTFCRLLLRKGEDLEVQTAGTLRPIHWDPAVGRRYRLADQPALADAMASGQPRVYVRGEAPQPLLDAASEDFGVSLGAVALFPLVGHGNTLGLLVLGEQRQPPRIPYRTHIVALYDLVAGMVAMELEHVQTEELFASSRELLQRRLRDLQFIHQSSLALVSGLDLHAALERAVVDLYQVLGAHSVFIFQVEGDRLRPLVWKYDPGFYQVGEAELLPRLPQRIGQGITGWVAQHGESLLVPDVREDPRSYLIEGVEMAEESFLAVPLRIRGKVQGVIATGKAGQRMYSERDLHLVDTFAASVGVAMENANLYQALQEKEKLLESLVRATRRITRQTEIDELLVEILDLAVEVIPGAQSGSILVREEEGFVFRGSVGYDLARLRSIVLPNDYVAARYPDNRVVLLDPPFDEEHLPVAIRRQLAEVGRSDQIQVILSAPIHVQGKLFGFFSLDNFERPDAFSKAAQDTLWLFAQQASIAIENALFFSQQGRMVRRLERDLEQISQLSSSKEEFFYMVSHELKTPLMVSIGSLELLRSYREDPERVEEYGTILQRHLKRLLTLIENILITSRGEIFSNLALRPLDLVALVREECAAARILAGPKGLEVVEGLESKPMVLNLDGDYMRQVLSNLLVNAVKFSEVGGDLRGDRRSSPRITVSLRREEGDALLCVADEGIGIDPQDLPHVFERFFHAANATRAAVAGTGLGLYTSKLIVEGHGGRIWLESQPGRGVQAWVRLPAELTPL
ncbi:MAG: GAF domain-containing sensor histidine kinase [Coprothermobacterota bacterium]|nr:GAF domain-containing sensor histidine kinase [Coprothermobacterota bacterium]